MRVQEISILVVDDVNAIRVQIKELLKAVGFEKITIAANGVDAIRFLNEETYHLILADWHMEPCNGMDLLKHIRGQAKTKDICFIMVTAESTKEKVLQAIQQGVDDYLVKPLTMSQIQGRVFKVLVGKKVLV